MNKTEFVAAVAAKAGLSKTDAANAVNAFTSVVAEALAQGDSVSLIGFGTFSVVDKPERTGINPRTKKKITIAARKAAKFKPSSSIKL